MPPSLPPLPRLPASRFRILERIGEGAMGEVFKAQDTALDRLVAVKLLRAGPARRWLLEAQFQASVLHEAVVPVHEVGLLQGRPCIVMAYIPGSNLWERRAELGPRELCALVAQACRGAHAAHCAGLIHRDLKPQNLLVREDEEGRPRAFLADFGLAREAQSPEASQSGLALGTPYYFSPEQALGERLLDARSDVYSLGATLYALLTGRPPFADEEEAPPEPDSEPRLLSRPPQDPARTLALVRRVAEEEVLPPRRLEPGIPRDLETILLKALEKAPEARYPTALALAEDLERHLAGEPILARPPSRAERLRRLARRHPGWSWAAALLLVAAITAPPLWIDYARRAEARARLSLRVATEAQEVAYRLRLAHMQPLQDRRPQLAWARARAQAMREELLAGGGSGEGPLAFLEGVSELQQDHPAQARSALERAWKAGFRSPEVAQALGEAAMEAYLSTLATDAPGDHAEAPRLATLDLLRLASQGGSTPLLRARTAFLEGRPDEALRAAAAALAETPWAYEIHLFIGQVWLHRLGEAQDLPACEAALRQALGAFDRAIALAPSDPKGYALKSFALRQLARRYTVGAGVAPCGLLEAAVEVCETGRRADPGYAPLAAHEALARYVWIRQGERRRSVGLDHPWFKAMMAEGEEALRLDPEDPVAVMARAWSLEAEAHRAWLLQLPDAEARFSRAGRLLDGLVAAHPDFSAPHLARAYLCSLREDLEREAGRDPRPYIRQTVAAYRESLRAMNPGLLAQGEPAVFRAELAGELIYLAEAELRLGAPRTALGLVDEAESLHRGLAGRARLLAHLGNDLAWARLLRADAELRLGRDPSAAFAAAEALEPALRDKLLDADPLRIPPFEEPLLRARQEIREGRDPRPGFARCRALALQALKAGPHADPAARYLGLAALEDALWRLPRGLDARAVALEGLRGLPGWRRQELRATRPDFAEALFRWILAAKPQAPPLAQLKALAARDRFFASDLGTGLQALAQLPPRGRS